MKQWVISNIEGRIYCRIKANNRKDALDKFIGEIEIHEG